MKFMDGDGFIEIIIYLLIAVGGIVANIYRNVNKQKEAKRQSEGMPPFFPDPDADSSYEYEEEEVKPVEQEVVFQESRPNEIFSVNDENYQQATERNKDYYKVEGSAAFAETTAEILSDDFEKPGSSFSDDLAGLMVDSEEISDLNPELVGRQKFDLRKAIIYSEIINPKYL